MKKFLSTLALLTLVLVCIFVLPTRADAASSSDLTFKLNEDGKSYSVTDCKETASGKLTIPSTYNGKPVTAIGEEAFYYCTNLTSVTIPNSVLTIDDYAFFYCESLTSLKIPNSVTTIGMQAFSECIGLTSITIGNGVTTIQERTFSGCTGLTSVTLGNDVSEIGDMAFYYCTSLSTITIPDSVTSVGDDAFYNCPITKIIIADGTKTITHAMIVCPDTLKEVVIPNGVTSIGNSAFYRCRNLESVIIPNSVTAIGDQAFYDCFALSSVTMSNNIKTIGFCAFYQCFALPSVTLPNTITYIDSGAFISCSSLADVYYAGTQAQWNKVYIGDYNDSLFNAKLHFAQKAKITKQPVSVTVANGAAAKTSVTATGDGITYTWYFKNKGASSYSKSSITTKTYSTTMDSNRDGRQVYCVVKDKYGNSVKSNVVTLSMKKTAKITAQPKTAAAPKGKTVKTTISATGDGLTYTWYFKNKGASSYSKSSITTNAYTMTADSTRNGRQVYCVVKDKYGNSVKSNVVTLYMGNPAKITKQPANVTVATGSAAKTTITASGDGLTYTWYFKNKGASSYSKSSITTNAYTMTADSTRNGRTVYCVVKDKYGNSVKSNVVTLYMGNPAKITKQPASANVLSGSQAKTTVTATGDGLTYTWYIKNKGATAWSKSSATGSSYSVTMKDTSNGRQVYCVVKDKYGNSVKSNVVTLTMKKVAKITKQPASVTVASGASAKITLTATGDGLTYTWYIKNKGATTWSKSSATGSSYSVTMKDTSNGRQVYCVVKDKYGNSVKSNIITLKMK